MSDVPGEPLRPTPPAEPASDVTSPFGAPKQKEITILPKLNPDPIPEQKLQNLNPEPPLVSDTRPNLYNPVPELIPEPTPTPTAPVFQPARFGNDLGPLMPTAGAETPAPNLAPEPIQGQGMDETVLDDPKPYSEPIPTSTPTATVEQPPVQATPTEGYHLGDTVVITPEMRTEIDRIKTEVASSQPTEPLTASTPLMTTVEQAPVQASPAPSPALEQPPVQPPAAEQDPSMAIPAATMLDAMGQTNFVPPVSAAELNGGPNFFDRIKAQNVNSQTEQPQTETPAPTKRSGFLSRLFGGGK